MLESYIEDPTKVAPMQTEVDGEFYKRTVPFRVDFTAEEAVAANTTGLHAAVADTGAQQVFTSFNSMPLNLQTGKPVARTVTITATGTAGDVKAVGHPIEGWDADGVFQSETVTPFTVNTLGTVESTKAYAVLSKHTQPPHDGTGVSFSVGWGNGLGLKRKLSLNTLKHAHLNGAREATLATMSISGSVLGLNWIKLQTALDGHAVSAFFDHP